jgi:hypothetical protein
MKLKNGLIKVLNFDNVNWTINAKIAKARQVKQGMMQELLTGKIRLVES